MFCFAICLSFEHSIGLNIIHSGGVWISGVSGGSTVPTLGSGSSARLFLFLPLQHFILHTHTGCEPGKSVYWCRRAHHELNTVYLGDLKTTEGTSDKTNTHPTTSTVGSRVMLLRRQETPLSAECSSRGRWKVKAVTALSFFSQTSISIFSIQWWWQFDPTSTGE